MKPFVPVDPDYENRTRASFGKQGAMAFIGARLDRVEPGRVEISLPFRPELSQQHGFFHAGMLSSIADTAGGYAGFTLFPPDGAVLTVEFKMNLMAAADGEVAIAVGEVVRSGRTLTVCRMDVFVDRHGKRTHCATGMQTLMCLVGRSGVTD
jgi:uncharacterized protein (TIGR00369 family)